MKRFISGATCPRCGQEDKVYVLKNGLQESMHCSQCDYVEQKKSEDSITVVEEWAPIKLFDT